MRKKLIAFLTVAGALVALGCWHGYYIRDGAVGQLFWNRDQAYVFLNVGRFGARISYLGYPLEVVRECLHGVRPPDARAYHVTVLAVSPERVQSYVANINLGTFFLFQNHLYAGSLDEGRLYEWMGSHFVPTIPEEQERIRNDQHHFDLEFSDVNGWSGRYAPVGGRFPISLKGRPITLVMDNGYLGSYLSIEVERPGQPAERVFYLNQRPHRVSRAEYERVFGTR